MMEYQQKLRQEKLRDEPVKPAAPPGDVTLEDAAVREMDDCIEQAFSCGDEDSLMQLLHVLLSEGYPIDFRVSSHHLFFILG